MDCVMLSMENPGRFSELKRGRVCSVSIDMESQLEFDEPSPFSAAFCSSYQLPKEDLEDGMVAVLFLMLYYNMGPNRLLFLTTIVFATAILLSSIRWSDLRIDHLLFYDSIRTCTSREQVWIGSQSRRLLSDCFLLCLKCCSCTCSGKSQSQLGDVVLVTQKWIESRRKN